MRAFWNTGCLYTSRGQEIAAEHNPETGDIFFCDMSRGIRGVIRAVDIFADVNNTSMLRGETMGHYLNNRYGWPHGDAEYRLLDTLSADARVHFDKVQPGAYIRR